MERRICAQTQDLQIFKKFNMSQMNPKEVFHNTTYSIQLPYIAGHSLYKASGTDRSTIFGDQNKIQREHLL